MIPFASAFFGQASARPVVTTLNLALTGPGLPSGVSASGGTGGRLVNAAGQLVGASAPRFDYDPLTHATRGLLVEPAAANLCLQSESFDASAWVKVNVVVTPNVLAAPDGSTSADLVAPTSAGAFMNQTIANMPGATYTHSCFFKPGNFQWLRFVVQSASGAQSSQFWFDLVNRTPGVGLVAAGTPVIVAYGIDDMGGGWTRCWATVQIPVETSVSLVLLASTGNGFTAQPVAAQYYAWGAQIEQGSRPTSYVGPTLAASATRSADAIGLTLPIGTSRLAFTFDDGSRQSVAVTAGAYTIPTNLNRARITAVTGTA